jgi:hypothetical protein
MTDIKWMKRAVEIAHQAEKDGADSFSAIYKMTIPG